jgi:hypothetical protein
MSRPDPIQYAERLYAAIRAANFSPISFLAFGSAVKDGIDLRRMPRIAAEPFMRVVGEMLELEEEMDQSVVDVEELDPSPSTVHSRSSTSSSTPAPEEAQRKVTDEPTRAAERDVGATGD